MNGVACMRCCMYSTQLQTCIYVHALQFPGYDLVMSSARAYQEAKIFGIFRFHAERMVCVANVETLDVLAANVVLHKFISMFRIFVDSRCRWTAAAATV